MRSRKAFALAASALIGLAAIGAFLHLQGLWCSAASYADTHVRLKGQSRAQNPPAGPIYLEPDSYYWLSYAQRIAAGEDWRIRYTRVDNYPEGREVHWSQVISWSMVVFGRVRASFTHEPMATAVEKASVAINPLLYAAAAAALLAALSRRFGVLPSSLFLAFLGSLPDTAWIFQALRPDHQGYHLVLGGISVVATLLGGMGFVGSERSEATSWQLFRQPAASTERNARIWFAVGGLATGLGLWVSSLVESFFIYPLVGLFMVLAGSISPERLAAEGFSARPKLWRIWGWTAGVTSLVFYLIEYFPRHMGLRLEVNHPIYSLAAVAAGEAMASLSELRWGGAGSSRRATVFRALVALALAATPVLLIAGGPIAWHHMRDPQMWRMSEGVQEFQPYNTLVKTHRAFSFWAAYGVLPFVSALAALLLRSARMKVVQETWVWITLGFASFFMAAGLLQSRWMGFGGATMCLCAMISAHYLWTVVPWRGSSLKAWTGAGVAAALLVQPIYFFSRPMGALQRDLLGKSVEEGLIVPLILKRMACALKASPDRPKAVIATSDLAPPLIYFSGIPVVTSLYWENIGGMRKATRFFAATNFDEARAVAREIGATHVMIPSTGSAARFFYHIAHGNLPVGRVEDTVAARLLSEHFPSWIQPDTSLNFLTNVDYVYLDVPVVVGVATFRIEP